MDRDRARRGEPSTPRALACAQETARTLAVPQAHGFTGSPRGHPAARRRRRAITAAICTRISVPERAICARMRESFESPPLPEHPLLAAWASTLNDVGYWANLFDAEWRYMFTTH